MKKAKQKSIREFKERIRKNQRRDVIDDLAKHAPSIFDGLMHCCQVCVADFEKLGNKLVRWSEDVAFFTLLMTAINIIFSCTNIYLVGRMWRWWE